MLSFAATSKVEPTDLARAFIYATDWLAVYVDEVNALNVYPVPDGDTGTNMHLTMQSVRKQLREVQPKDMSELAQALAYGSLLGARGNSGVILSQVLKGFAETIREKRQLSSSDCIEAFKNASNSAYAAVVKPVEGTILTVVRRASEGLDAEHLAHPLEVFKKAWHEGKRALDETPDMLPVLKQAGVVDSGGLGFLRLLEGVIAAFEGKELPEPPKIEARAQEAFEEEAFGFCTEFLLADATTTPQAILDMVADFGDSQLVVGAEGFIKGHIHTEEPERLLALVSRYGKMLRSKVEDMSEQHSEILDGIDVKDVRQAQSNLVVVSNGYGVTKVFRGLGARVVAGGQSSNPSVEDIADAVRSVEADNVLILPNNKNIILAAQQVAELLPDKRVEVIPTRTLGQGLAAAVLFDESADIVELTPALQEAAEHAVTFEVTTASRSAMIDGVEAIEGQYIGLQDGTLRCCCPSPEAALLELFAQLEHDDYEVASLFHNSTVTEGVLEHLQTQLTELAEDIEVECHPGGPELYHYLVVVE